MANSVNPIASRIARSPSEVERRVLCVSYEDCLDETIRRKWRGFSCQKCHAFRPVQLNPSEWLADSLACVALLYVAEFQTSFKQQRRGSIVLRLQRLRSRLRLCRREVLRQFAGGIAGGRARVAATEVVGAEGAGGHPGRTREGLAGEASGFW